MKRFLYIIAVFLVSLLLVGSMIVAALMSDKVETAAVRLVTAELSRALGTHATVGAVEYRFPARVAVKEVYLEDQQGDTLLFVGELFAHFSPMALRGGEVLFSHVRLTDVVADIHQVEVPSDKGPSDKVPSDKGPSDKGPSDKVPSTKVWNYQFLVDAFKTDRKKDQQPLKSLISVRDVQLDNIRLRYEDYLILLSHSAMDLYELSEDKFDAEIRELAAVVRKPAVLHAPSELIVEDIRAHVILTDSMLSAPTLRAQLPQSRLDLSGVEMHYSAPEPLRLRAKELDADKVHFALQFNEAELVPAEIALFLPNLKGMKKPFTLRGTLDGTLDSIAFNGLTMQYDGRTFIEGNVSAVGLPDMHNPYLVANLTDMHTNAAQLQDLLSQLKGRPVRLPKQLHRLGNVHYRGLASGRLHDLTLHGAFKTALGAITTDGSFRADSLFEHMAYDARVEARRFRLGRMLDVAKLGTVTVDVSSAGQIDTGQVNGSVKAHVRQLTYNRYTFADLTINGHYSPQRYKGSCAIHDPHLDASFDGLVDLRDENPDVNCNLVCRHFDSQTLGIRLLGDQLRTKFSLAVDMSGTNPDNVSGYAVIDSLALVTARDSVMMNQLKLIASATADGSKAITLTADYLNGTVDGEFRYRDLVPAAQALMHHYLPTAIAAPKREWHPVSFFMRVNGERLRDVQRLFVAPITISDHPTFTADVAISPHERIEPRVNMRFFAPGVLAGNTPVHELTVTLNTIDSRHHSSGSELALSVSAEAMQMHSVVSMLAFRDTVLTHLTMRHEAQMSELLPEGWEKLSPRELQRALSSDLTMHERQQALLAAQRAGDYGGDIRFITHFSRYNRKPLIEMHFQPGTLLLRDSIYTLGESRITYCAADTSLDVDHFSFEGGGQHIRANGMASRRATDTIEVDLLKLQAGYIVPFLLPVQTIMFNGLLTGRANISSLFSAPSVDTQIHIDSMGLNNCYFGDAEVDLHIKDSLAFHADVYRPERKVVDLNGKALFTNGGVWELDMRADSVPLAFVNHWTATVLQNLDGYATGRVKVGGYKGMTYVLVRAAAQDASLTLPWTGVRYTIDSDTIVMDTTAILFPNVHLTDPEGNRVEVNGGVYHDQFQDFALDLHVDAHDALVFNKNTQGEMVQGTVYATGHVDVTGQEKDIIVAAEARTSRNSKFRLSIDNVSSAYESSFVHFVEHPDTTKASIAMETDLDNIDIKREAGVDSTMYMRAGRCLLKLNIEVNPYLLFQLVLGERNGDVIQARGNGALQLSYETESGDVSLLGTYDIDKGTLSYTVANVIRKEFTVGTGSTISFSGDATNPNLNVTANYRVTANLKDLFGEDVNQLGIARSSIPVTTCLHLTGPLNNPILSFSLEFPTSDQNIQAQVRQIINTDEMLMRQVIYLLVFGRFFTPDNMANTQAATLNSTYSLLSSTVTSQINAWLSKLTDMLTLGVAIRSEGQGSNNQEYEAQFQLQPVDRLVINGNVGYRYNEISNQPFFGDLDVEVLLTEDGQWRLKGYTHMVDKYSLRQASTIQGVGVMWKKDF